IDDALDVEDRVDPLHRLERDRRDDGWGAPSPLELVRGIGKLEQLAPAMCPTERAGERGWRSARPEQLVIAGIGIGLEDPAIARQVVDGMLAAPISRILEQRRRRSAPAERAVVADIGPQPSGIGLPLGENRHRGVVAMETLGGEHMRFDEEIERPERGGAGADLVGERRQAEGYALTLVTVA